MPLLFHLSADIPPLPSSGVGGGDWECNRGLEDDRTYLDVAPYLRTECAAVYVDADCEPCCSVLRCHVIEQRTRVGGRLDAMQAHVPSELDGQSELCLEDGKLVRKGRREWRQRAVAAVIVVVPSL